MQSRQAVFVPKRHVPSGERLEPVVPGHGRPVKVNPPPWQRPNRQRGSEAARKASAPAALQRPHGIHPLQRKSDMSTIASLGKKVPSSFLPPVRFPLAAGGSGSAPPSPRVRARVFPYSNLPQRQKGSAPIGGGRLAGTWWRACLTRIWLDSNRAGGHRFVPRGGGGDAQEQGEALRRPAQGLQARQVVSRDRFLLLPGCRRMGNLTSAAVFVFLFYQ